MAATSTTLYDERFFQRIAEGSLRSAQAVVPLVMDLVVPRSVLDVGCGIGTWLRVFADAGVSDYLGVDGDYVQRAQLLIPPERFRAMNLTHPEPLGRRFDLAVCLEVAEHLPERSANGLVRFLSTAAPAVLFSAAVPGQGGDKHVNEQWPAYWRDRFAEHHYVRLDPIRPKIWRHPRVEFWYKQNIYLFVLETELAGRPRLAEEYRLAQDNPFELLSTRVLASSVELAPLLAQLAGALRRKLARLTSPRPGSTNAR